MDDASDRDVPRLTHQFSHPNGRTVHVASNPHTAETLRRQLTDSHGEGGFDLYLRGSDEHVKALQEAHAYQEQRRRDLSKDNPEVWQEYDRVRKELDTLSYELNRLTEQNVSLDANFGRFGYSAHIKTLEDDDAASTSGLSRTTSARSEGGEKPTGESIKLWRRPVVRQYFHKGFIWRASESAEVTSMELFVDLIFVGLIAVIGDTAAEDPTGISLLWFCITLILAYQMWSAVTTVMSWFVSNDLFQRTCIMFYIACLVGYSTNVQHANDSTYTELIAFYLTGRLFQVSYYALLFFLIPMLQMFFVFASIIILVPSALYMASIHVEYPANLGLIWVAIFIDLYGQGLLIPIFRSAEKLEGTSLSSLAQRAQFYPAINIEHRTERMNAFVTLVIGYSVVALLYQSNAPDGTNAFFGKAVLGLLIAVSFGLIYFEIDSSNIYVHAIRRHAVSYGLWQQTHMPFVLAFTLASAALAKLVVARDCPDTPIEALADTFAEKSVEEIDPGLRWFFCGGIGVALACTVAISSAHDHKPLPGLRLSKRNRLILRMICAIVIIIIPTAGDRLNSLDLLAVVAGILFACLLVEFWGCSDCNQGSFWADGGYCKYAAECKLGKKDLEALRNGEVNGIEELVQRRREKKSEQDRADIM